MPGNESENSILQLQEQARQALSGLPYEAMRRKIMHLASDQRFLASAQKLYSHPNRKMFLYSELGFLLFMMIFKAWRHSCQSHWFGKLFVSLYCTLLFWGGMLFILPYLLFGEPYRLVVKAIWALFA